MKEILKPDSRVIMLTSKQVLKNNCTYKWSIYTFVFNIEKKVYLYNTLTKQCFDMEQEKIEVNFKARFKSNAFTNIETFKVLLEEHFIVEENIKEEENYVNIISLLRALDKVDGYSTYEILPTMKCNARCFYCYEHDLEMKQSTMKEETIDEVVRFIINTKQKKKIKIKWFGGEPLVATRVIDKICNQLKKNNVDFFSEMVSNGILINDNIAEKMKNDWNMKSIQISVDGDEKSYNKIKNYICNYESAYKVMLENIHRLLDRDINVVMRCNVDEQNSVGIDNFLDDINKEFLNKNNLNVVFKPLYGASQKVTDFCREKNIKVRSYGMKGKKNNISRLKTYYCMAQKFKRIIKINPDGLLYNCNHSNKSIGNIKQGITNIEYLNDYEIIDNVSEKCKGCSFIPICTTFNKCDVKRENCKMNVEKNLQQALMEEIMEAK